VCECVGSRAQKHLVMRAQLLAALVAGASAKTALIIVDTQLCFTNELNASAPFAACDPNTDDCSRSGTLGVASGASIVPTINELRAEKGCLFDLIVRTQDFHPAGHISFGSSHFGDGSANSGFDFMGGPLPYVGYAVNVHCTESMTGMIADAQCCLVDTTQAACTALTGGCTAGDDVDNAACTTCASDPSSCIEMPQALWTDHCLQDGDSGFATGLVTSSEDIVVQKGTNKYVDAYSAFMDNAKVHKTALDDTLKANGIDTLYITGIATDFCVSWTAQDAVDLGYDTSVILDATAAIGLDNGDGTTSVDTALAEFTAKGVKIVNAADVLGIACPPTTPPPPSPPEAPPLPPFPPPPQNKCECNCCQSSSDCTMVVAYIDLPIVDGTPDYRCSASDCVALCYAAEPDKCDRIGNIELSSTYEMTGPSGNPTGGAPVLLECSDTWEPQCLAADAAACRLLPGTGATLLERAYSDCFGVATGSAGAAAERVEVAQLAAGDWVLGASAVDGALRAERVLVNQHRAAPLAATLLELHHAAGSLALTADHLVRAKSAFVPASHVAVGDELELAGGAKAAVERIELRAGAVVNPVTASGTILVGGARGAAVLASTYSSWMAALMHAPSPLRFPLFSHVSHLFPAATQAYYDRVVEAVLEPALPSFAAAASATPPAFSLLVALIADGAAALGFALYCIGASPAAAAAAAAALAAGCATARKSRGPRLA